jgi:hypothetical protein
MVMALEVMARLSYQRPFSFSSLMVMPGLYSSKQEIPKAERQG